MAHKANRKYLDSDNSRKAFRWRLRKGCMTSADKKRKEMMETTEHGKKLKALIESGEIKTKIIRGGKKMFNLRKH